VLEHDAVSRQPVEHRARVAVVAVDPEAVRPQGIDHQEDDIQVVALGERGDVIHRPLRARGNLQLELTRDRDDEQHSGTDEVELGRIE